MTVDVASLIFEIDSTQAVTARKRLEDLEQVGARVDRGARSTKTATELAGIGLAKYGAGAAAAARAATAHASAEGAVEKAIRASGAASAATRQQRNLDAAAMREQVLAGKAYDRSLREQAQAVAALKASVDPLGAAIARMNKELSTASALHANGAINDAEYGRAQTVLASRLNALSTIHGKAAAGAKLQAHELGNLSAQVADIGVSLASGQALWLVAIQQGAQVGQVFGQAAARGVSFGSAIKDLGGAAAGVLGRAGPIAVGVGLVGALAIAFKQGSDESAAFSNSLTITGNYAGLTAQKYEDMAARIADTTDSSVRSNKAAIGDLVASGKFTGETIELMVTSAQKFSKYTGQSATEIVKDYEQMKGGVVQWAVAHTQRYHDLTLAQIDYIALLVKQGKHEQAEAQLMQDIADGISTKAVPAYGFLEQALHDVAKAASNMWDELLGIGRPQTIEQQIADQVAKLGSIQTPYNRQQAGYEGNVATAQMRLDIMQNLIKGPADAKAAADAKRAQEEDDKIRAKYGAGATKPPKGPRDASQQAIDAASRAELTARMALTKDIETLAAFRKREVDLEQAAIAHRMEQEVARGSISKAAAATATALYAQAAIDQKALIDRETAEGLLDREISQREAIGGNLERTAAIQASMAGSAAEQARIEADSIRARQELDRYALEERLKQQVVAGEITATYQAVLLQSQADLHAAEAAQAERNKHVATWADRTRLATSDLELQIDLLSSQGAIARTAYERHAVDRDILQAQQKIARLKLDEVIAATEAGSVERRIAEDRKAELAAIQANELEAFRLDALDSAVSETARAIDDIGDAIRDHDWGSVFTSLIKAVDQAVVAFATAKTGAEQMSASGSLISAVGGAVGGKAGSVLGSVGSGFSAAGAVTSAATTMKAMGGATASFGGAIAGLAGPIGIAVAGFSLLSGILGDQKAKKRAKLEQEARDMENARAAAQEQANKQAELQLRVLELSGDEIGAVTMRRQAELAALQGANRALAEHVHALEDWAKAVDAGKAAVSKAEDDLRDAYEADKDRLLGVIGGVEAARDRLNQAYQRERSAIEGTISSVRSLVKTFADFRAEIDAMAVANDPSRQYGFAQRQFAGASNDNLVERGRAFAEASQSASATDLDFQRDLAAVRRRTDEAAKTAQTQLTAAEKQLLALDNLMNPLLGANDNLLTIDEAIRGLLTAEQEAALATEELARLDAQVGALITINISVLSVAQAVSNLQGALGALAAAQAAKPAGGAAGGGSQAVGLAGYVDKNADLAALYASGGGMAAGRSKEEFAAYHWERYGQAESRAFRPFARGGAFTNGIVSEPTPFNMGVMGEQGPEAIMPLEMGPNGLGVRSRGGGDTARLESLVEELKDEITQLRLQQREDNLQIKRNTKDSARILGDVTQGGDSVRTVAA